MEVLGSWMAQITESGWLPREQIHGLEAGDRVPDQFQVQKPHIANPPTQILALRRLADQVEDKATFKTWLNEHWTALRRHVTWLETSQRTEDGHFM